MAKKFTLRVWHLIVLMVILILLAKGGQFERMGLAGRTAGVTFADYTSSGCEQTNIAYPQYAQLKCEKGALTTISISDSANGLLSGIITQKMELYDAYVASAANGVTQSITIDDSNGNNLCRWGTGGCSNQGLAYGETYEYECWGVNCQLKIAGYRSNLYFYTPDAVAGEKVENTENCLAQNWFYEAEKTSIWDEVKQIIKGKDAIDNTGKNILGSSTGSVTMDLGNSFKYLYAYTEKAPLGIQNYNNQLVHCDQNEQLLIGFQRLSGLDGSCWVSPDYSNIIKDGSGKKFCCNSQACTSLGLSSDYVCQDFECVYKGVVTGGCNSPSDCGAIKDYITDADGQAYLIEAVCDKIRPQQGWLGTCDQSKTKINCNPELTYANNQCCKFQDGKYSLVGCTSQLNDCAATLGSNACCLEIQSDYTIHECGSDLECCGADEDGIGICSKSCAVIVTEGWWDSLVGSVGKMFGIAGEVAKVLTWILIILAVIVVLVLLSKAGRGRGGFGIGGMGTPVTIANIVNGANPSNWGTKPGWTMPQGVQTYSLGKWIKRRK